jgi:polysaccharide biosynthesis protein PslE
MNDGALSTRPVPVIQATPAALSVREVADLVCRQRWMLVLWVAIACGSLAAYIYLAAPVYKSQVTFLLMNQRPVPSAQGEGAGSIVSTEVSDSQVATEIQLMSSHETLKQIVEAAHLLPDSVSKEDRPRQIAKAEKKLSKSLTITPDGKSSMITVAYRGDSPEQTTRVLQTLANVYLARQYQIHKSAGSYQFFREQADNYQKEWKTAQQQLSAFESKTKVLVLEEQKDLEIRKLNALEASLREAESAVSEANHKKDVLEQQITRLEPRIVTQQRAIPNQYSAERLNTMIVDLRNKKTELLTKFRADSRQVQEIDQQITQTQSALDRAAQGQATEEATDVNPLRQTLESQVLQSGSTVAGLNARVATLTTQIAQCRWRIDQLGKATGEYERLAREVKEDESKYLLYSRQSEQSRISDEMDRQRIANVVVADGPERPIAAEPKVNLNVLFAFLFAICLVVPLAFVRGLRRRQVYTPWELEGIVGVPVLGTVLESSRS